MIRSYVYYENWFRSQKDLTVFMKNIRIFYSRYIFLNNFVKTTLSPITMGQCGSKEHELIRNETSQSEYRPAYKEIRRVSQNHVPIQKENQPKSPVKRPTSPEKQPTPLESWRGCGCG